MKNFMLLLFVLFFTATCVGNSQTFEREPLSFTNLEISDFNHNTYSDSDEATELGKIHLGFQPLGFLQFGPVFELGFRVGKNFLIGPQFRYMSLGLLYMVIMDHHQTMGCYAVGGSFKHFPTYKQKNKFYYGLSVEYQYGADEGYNWHGEHAGLVLLSNTGYRFRFNSGFYMNLGLFAGTYINFLDETYRSGILYEEGGYIHFAGFMDFGLGFEL